MLRLDLETFFLGTAMILGLVLRAALSARVSA
jgi:hypothetical protein